MTTVSVSSSRVKGACQEYIEYRELSIKLKHDTAISELMLKRRWFRKNFTQEEALAEYKASGEWNETSELWYYQNDRVNLLFKVANVSNFK
jgi:hypothetical protein